MDTKLIIRKKEDYVAAGLGRVTELRALDVAAAVEANEPVAIYEGFAIIGAQANGKIMQVPVEFIMPGVNSLEAAFEGFQKFATERFKAMMEEVKQQATSEQNRIITAPPGMKLVQG